VLASSGESVGPILIDSELPHSWQRGVILLDFQSMEAIPPETLLDAYTRGIFPMAENGKILWFSPEQRGIIPLDDRFHIPHGLRQAMRRKPFEVRWNTAFRDVMLGCADRPETWIDDVILTSYCQLHEIGYAHSVECWDADGLQGGLYGVALPGVFFGESMFSRKSNASKIALVALVNSLRAAGFELLDTQWLTSHLKQFGGYEISRADYHAALAAALDGGLPSDVGAGRRESV
jgi:leucyl/phenylalanyl-tRNA--protein transferase